MLTRFLPALILFFCLATQASEIPEQLKLKPILMACKSDRPEFQMVCMGYLTRIIHSSKTQSDVYDLGFINGVIWSSVINKDNGTSLVNYMESIDFQKNKIEELHAEFGCIKNDTPNGVKEKLVTWSSKNPKYAESFIDDALIKFFKDTYNCTN